MNQLPDRIRETLIEMGRAAQARKDVSRDDIERLRPCDSINRQSPDFWQKTAANLSDDEIAMLAGGLTYVEAQLKWMGGSVSGVIWLFQALIGRNARISLLDEIYQWILENTKNPYNPFGTRISLGARNYSEYLQLSSTRAIKIARCVELDAGAESVAKAELQLRRKMAAAGAEARNTHVRKRIIESLNPLPLAEKLEQISNDPTFPPQFFPTSIADAATQDVVDALPEEIRVELSRRLKGKRRGPWGSFRKRLTKSLGLIWNRKPWRV